MSAELKIVLIEFAGSHRTGRNPPQRIVIKMSAVMIQGHNPFPAAQYGVSVRLAAAAGAYLAGGFDVVSIELAAHTGPSFDTALPDQYSRNLVENPRLFPFLSNLLQAGGGQKQHAAHQQQGRRRHDRA